ncbi:hypothetical protein [Neorhizobium sp. NCHU2750]|uniref:hypothetical protein n=1 Tax=Neorhizobium sp. NCHU2750 TaxID=1825976 RepID=UPI000E727BCB|nr:hypothetical protein NCHU2750_31820 [Neorhizobium sp. NCHU2750]
MAEIGNDGKVASHQPALRADLRDVTRAILFAMLSRLNGIYWRHAGLISVVVLVAFAAMMLVLGQVHRIYNWDMLAYLASTELGRMGSATDIHSYAYSIVKNAAPAQDFTQLIQADAYRTRQFADPQAFASMLGMYEVKWLYVFLLKLLIPVVGPVLAFDVINGGALIILTIAIGLWLNATKLQGYAPLVVGLLFLLQFQGFAVTQQPDFLANALLVAALLSYDRGRDVLGSILMLISVLLRPDQVAVAGVLMACVWFLRDRGILVFAASFAASLVAYVILSQTFHPTGWWPHFWFSTYKIQEDMTGFEPAFSLKVYIEAIALNLYRSLFLNTWLAAYIVAIGCGAMIYFKGLLPNRRRQALMLALLLAIAAKFVIFPLHDGRIYFSPLFVFFLLAFAGLRARGGVSQVSAKA